MRMGWGTAVCVVVLGGAVGFVCGHVSAWTRAATRPAPALTALTELRPIAEIPLTAPEESEEGPVFFPERMTPPPLESAEAETIHADAIVETGGELGVPPVREPAALLQPDDAAPISPEGQKALRTVLESELSDLSPADREVWLDVLEGLPAADAVGIVRLWKKFGTGPGLLSGSPSALSELDTHGLPEPSSGAAQNSMTQPASPQTNLQVARQLYIQNLLCAETYGYRRIEPLFAIPLPAPARLETNFASERSTLRCIGWRTNHIHGELVPTSEPLDVAIDGGGFFVVTHPVEGRLFTRCGQFSRAADRRLVLSTSCGELPVSPEIVIPDNASDIAISNEGKVTVELDGGDTQDIGTLSLALFVAPAQLRWRSDALFSATDGSGAPQLGPPAAGSRGKLLQGQLERSNVQNAVETAWLRQIDEWLQLMQAP